MKYSLLIVVALIMLINFVLLARAQEEGEEEAKVAKLIIHKDAPVNNVINTNITFTVTVYNVGASTAYNVQLRDAEYPSEFEVLSGESATTFEEIAPGANASFAYTIVGKTVGDWASIPAKATYANKPNAEATVTAHSTNFGGQPLRVMTQSAYDKLQDSKTTAYILFALTFLLPIVAPLVLHGYSNNQIRDLANNK
mmetsp:Transcript_3188/g.4709  ORF Transcript_3188/g.4709 Transcript_3188/m.4709 type:complete len:197 (+) Transcript_3188:60-650(+)